MSPCLCPPSPHSELLNADAGRPWKHSPRSRCWPRLRRVNQGRDQRRFVLFPRQALGGTVGRELEQAARAARRWHRIHGSCFLQCFMPTATAALQMRVNIAGGAVHPGSSPVAWSECQTPPSRVTSAQRTHCVIPPPTTTTPPSLLFCPLLPVDGRPSPRTDEGEICLSTAASLPFRLLMENK